jgi:signal peptidase
MKPDQAARGDFIKQRSGFSRTLNFVTTLALALLCVLLLFTVYGTLPNRWYQVLAVTSGSMSPAIRAGDMIVVTRPPETLEPGMVLTLMVSGNLVTHRLVAVNPDGTLITRGDANPTNDDWSGVNVQVKGLYRARIPYMGYILNIRQALGLSG